MRCVPARYVCLLVLSGVMGAATSAHAQDVTIVGSVTDEQKGFLPGVTVTATATATGRQFADTTNEQGLYRLVGLSAGVYNVEAALDGFAPFQLANIELLVGQNATIPILLKLASLSETLTVTGEAALVDTTQARVAGNVDRRQMEELPIAGRNWQQLASMVKGITANTITTRPGVSRDAAFSLNLDGQDITQNASNSGFGQPGISRDAIAEFQVITNLFDVTMGRSTGIQVQAISRAGTNALTGSIYGFFRDDALNAKDAFAGRVLPYSNRQVGGTLGGPVVRDKVHFFGSYEHETEPNTVVYTVSALGGQRFETPTERTARSALGRLDYQVTPKDHLTVRSGYWRDFSYSASGHPTRDVTRLYDSNYTTAVLARVGSNSRLHELKLNYFHYHWLVEPAPGVPLIPNYSFPGLSLGTPNNQPQNWFEDFFTTRYDLTWNTTAHSFKVGAEFRAGGEEGWWLKGSRGTMLFSRLPADAERRFPADAALDPSRWDLTGLDALATRFTINYAQMGGGKEGYGNFTFDTPRPMFAGWIGDTWRLGSRLSMNYGVRYDVSWEDLSPPDVQETTVIVDSGFDVRDFGYRNDIRDLNNVAPRVGLAWNVTGDNDFVIRGGTGLYFSTANSNQPVDVQMWNGQRVMTNTYVNDGQPGWALDPTRGVIADDVISGRVPLQPQSVYVIAHDFEMPYAWQSMVGFQKQVGSVMAFDADLVHYVGRKEDSQRDPNVFYDPVTGLPKNANVFGRPNPDYGQIQLRESHGKSDYLALATSLTRRYRNNFQFGATYTFMFYKRDTGIGSAGYGATQLNPFDIMADWADSSDFQRHTVRANGVWTLPLGFSLSGSFGYGSGNPSSTTSTNVDPLALGTSRIRSDLSIIPRNNFMRDPFQTLDVRVSKDFALGGSVKLTGIAEVFNAYNYKRYTYNTLETSSTFGSINGSDGSPRTGQLAFKVSF